MSQYDDEVAERYRALVLKHGGVPPATQMSAEGQRFRFAKLCEIDDLRGAKVLDLGCGVGHLYTFLREHVADVDYHGIDRLPEMVEQARERHPGVDFQARNVTVDGVGDSYDYALMSALFNDARRDAEDNLRTLVSLAFGACTKGAAFNFLSTINNFTDATLAYHDPPEILAWLIREVTPRVSLHHHYERADVAVFLYR